MSFHNESQKLLISFLVSHNYNITKLDLYLYNQTQLVLNPNITANVSCSAISNQIGVAQQYRKPFAEGILFYFTIGFNKFI